jgi:hypothetical protein
MRFAAVIWRSSSVQGEFITDSTEVQNGRVQWRCGQANRSPCLKSLRLISNKGNTMNNPTRIAAALFAVALSPMALASAPVVNQGISEAEVLAGQKAWCQALVDISATHQRDGQAAAKALAEKVIDAAYGYQMGAVLFKPTLTVVPQTFRPTREGALAYFVGGNAAFPKDTGFALKGWSKCEVANSAVFIAGDSATTMGNVMFTGPDGKVTSVDKTWGFVKDDKGALRIVVHHSSLPFSGS